MAARLVLLLTFVALSLVLGLAHAGYDYPGSDSHAPTYPPQDVCFYKKQKCCYKFDICGYETKKVPISKQCDFKKCEHKCKKVCDKKKHKVAYKVCEYKKVKVYIVKCEKSYGDYPYKTQGYGGNKEPKCKKIPVYKKKKVCEIKYKYVVKPVCEKKCFKECYLVKAVCKGYKLVKYAKYCPKIYCDELYVDGKEPKVSEIIGEKGEEVKKEYVDKKIIGKKLIKKEH